MRAFLHFLFIVVIPLVVKDPWLKRVMVAPGADETVYKQTVKAVTDAIARGDVLNFR